MERLIEVESKRLIQGHQKMRLKKMLVISNAPAEDNRNKGLYFGADSAANWWQRNLRMYAIVQYHATPGERVLVNAGSGHTAILRDLLRADTERLAEDVLKYF